MQTKKIKTATLVKTRVKALPVVAIIVLIVVAATTISYSLFFMVAGIGQISSSIERTDQIATSSAIQIDDDVIYPPAISGGEKSAALGLPFDYPRQTIALRGKIVVDVYFLESTAASPNTENWTDDEINEKMSTIQADAAWLQSAANAAQSSANTSINVNFMGKADTDFEPITEFASSCPRAREQADHILLDVTKKLNFDYPAVPPGESASETVMDRLNIRKYQRLTETNADDHYFVFLIDTSDYMSHIDEICSGRSNEEECKRGCSCFATHGGPYLILFSDKINPGEPDIFAHESGHIFYAYDQYSVCTCASTYNGCSNSDCTNCYSYSPNPSHTTLMGANKRNFLGDATTCHLGLICSADAHEGDSPFTAQIFKSREINGGSHICPDRDEDWYKIVTDSQGKIKINLTSPAGRDYNLSLYDQSGEFISSSVQGLGQPDEINYDGPAGTYFFKVWGGSPSDADNISKVTYWDKDAPYTVSYRFIAGLPCASCYVPASCSR